MDVFTAAPRLDYWLDLVHLGEPEIMPQACQKQGEPHLGQAIDSLTAHGDPRLIQDKSSRITAV